MAGPKTIRALERGLEVMEYLQHKGAATLNDIYKATQLPRPTLLRILRTLEIGGLVRRGIGDGLYRNSFRLQRFAENLDQGDLLAEIAAPVVNRLCAEIRWPSDLVVLNPGGELYLELKETSRPNSPFPLNRVNIGHRVNIPLSAAGRVYLAFCPEEEREVLIERLAASDSPTNHSVRQRQVFDAMLDVVRKVGYGARDQAYSRGYYGAGSVDDDGLRSIAMPVRRGVDICGAVTLTWLRDAMELDEFVKLYLDRLREAADQISSEMEKVDR